MRSQDVYQIVRKTLGPSCKHLGWKRTKQAAGWYTKLDCGYFTCGWSVSHWNRFVGSTLSVNFQMSEQKLERIERLVPGSQTCSLGEFLGQAECESAGLIHNSVITKLSMPPDNSVWLSETLRGHFEKAVTPWTAGVPDLRCHDATDVERWCLFVKDRLPQIMLAFSQEWSKQNPDAAPLEQSPPISYEPWQEILESPEIDQPRLVYADWLEERGDPRGEFVRVQCELAGLEEGERKQTLRKQEKQLLRAHRVQWEAEFEKIPVSKVSFHRGFANSASITAKQFLTAGDRIFKAMPLLTHVRFKSAGDRLRDLAKSPQLSRIVGMALLNTRIQRISDLDDLLMSPHWTQLREVDLSRMKPSTSLIQTLTHSKRFEQLTHLNLRNCHLHDHLDALLDSPHLATLEFLNIEANRISLDDAERIANCSGLSNLKELCIGHNALGGNGVAALASSPYLTKLRVLRMNRVRLSVIGIHALRDPNNLPSLQAVENHDLGIDEKDWTALKERCQVLQ